MKKKVLPIVMISVLGAGLICSIFPALAIGKRTFINADRLADISAFLDSEEVLHVYYYDENVYKARNDDNNEIKDYLKSLTFEKVNDKYSKEINYSKYTFSCNNRALRFNTDFNRCVIDYDDKGNHFTAIKVFDTDSCDSKHLIELISKAKEIRS